MSAKSIPLTKGYVAIVDEADYARVSQYSWCAAVRGRCVYAQSSIDGHRVYLHRFLLIPPESLTVDHIDGNGLDCRRSNLRVVTHAQNNQNTTGRCGSSSPFKGVYKGRGQKRGRVWRVQIKVNGSVITESHATELEAAKAYNALAAAHFGEFARLNQVPQ